MRSVEDLIAAMEAFLEAEEMNGECGWGSGLGFGIVGLLGWWEFVGEGGVGGLREGVQLFCTKDVSSICMENTQPVWTKDVLLIYMQVTIWI